METFYLFFKHARYLHSDHMSYVGGAGLVLGILVRPRCRTECMAGIDVKL